MTGKVLFQNNEEYSNKHLDTKRSSGKGLKFKENLQPQRFYKDSNSNEKFLKSVSRIHSNHFQSRIVFGLLFQISDE